jgi:hypothetical protein
MNKISSNPLWDISPSYQKIAAMKAAIKLDIFTKIGNRCLSVERISGITGASPREVLKRCWS